MIWTTILVIVVGAILKFLTCPPSALVGWFLSKFELHPKLDSKDITVTINGNPLQAEEKDRFTNYFNEAQFLNRNPIFQGNEELYLNPDTEVIPFIINVKRRNKEINFFVYNDNKDDHIFIVKQQKKKVASYNLRSLYIQQFATSYRINETA
ncbi:YfmQ family protein [Oceanobacillus polygoni]|uniref:Uncharacterized protein n=1 Tax=Oceanobacillus polygoni TaxID=1235259 RepID=A0A9X0YTV7_9BACI|nr:YfmQ family protein [Oceanobacillus polygoni]MBP2078788.1 hypothetical protein [Oceanobacillus polygoni]